MKKRGEEVQKRIAVRDSVSSGAGAREQAAVAEIPAGCSC